MGMLTAGQPTMVVFVRQEWIVRTLPPIASGVSRDQHRRALVQAAYFSGIVHLAADPFDPLARRVGGSLCLMALAHRFIAVAHRFGAPAHLPPGKD